MQSKSKEKESNYEKTQRKPVPPREEEEEEDTPLYLTYTYTTTNTANPPLLKDRAAIFAMKTTCPKHLILNIFSQASMNKVRTGRQITKPGHYQNPRAASQSVRSNNEQRTNDYRSVKASLLGSYLLGCLSFSLERKEGEAEVVEVGVEVGDGD